MKRKLLVSLMIPLLALAACSDDDVKAPELEITEVGYENSGIAYAGSDLHINANIMAEGKIDNVRLTIHPGEAHLKDGHDQHEEWQVDTTYTTGLSGSKNAEFHEHVDVPEHAEEGEYHLHLQVVDMEGQQSSSEAEFEVVYDPDHEHEEIH
ncbi:MAG: DUF4625 domain-containing protein [Marinilabiliaceae bacterium]